MNECDFFFLSWEHFDIVINTLAYKTSFWHFTCGVIKKDCLSWQYNYEHFFIRLFAALQPDMFCWFIWQISDVTLIATKWYLGYESKN
jgi:hypothetical protein